MFWALLPFFEGLSHIFGGLSHFSLILFECSPMFLEGFSYSCRILSHVFGGLSQEKGTGTPQAGVPSEFRAPATQAPARRSSSVPPGHLRGRGCGPATLQQKGAQPKGESHIRPKCSLKSLTFPP